MFEQIWIFHLGAKWLCKVVYVALSGWNSARICDITIGQLSIDFVHRFSQFFIFSWISIVLLIKFIHECMHIHLSPNIPKYKRRGKMHLVTRHMLRRQLLRHWYLSGDRVRLRGIIGFLVQGRVRIRIRVRVKVRVRVYVSFNIRISCRSICMYVMEPCIFMKSEIL